MDESLQIEKIDYDQSLPIVDREHIDMLLVSDPSKETMDMALAEELIELFELENSRELDLLPEVCARGDLNELRRIVHFVAGSAGNMGLARLHSFYAAVEGAVDRGTLVDLTGAELKLRAAFDGSVEAFRREFNL